jgi:hypothetical protein
MVPPRGCPIRRAWRSAVTAFTCPKHARQLPPVVLVLTPTEAAR